MKTEKIILTLVLVVICILITQIFLAMAVLMLCENINSRIEIIAYVSSLAPGIILGLFLGNLFELLTGIDVFYIERIYYIERNEFR